MRYEYKTVAVESYWNKIQTGQKKEFFHLVNLDEKINEMAEEGWDHYFTVASDSEGRIFVLHFRRAKLSVLGIRYAYPPSMVREGWAIGDVETRIHAALQEAYPGSTIELVRGHATTQTVVKGNEAAKEYGPAEVARIAQKAVDDYTDQLAGRKP